MKKGQRKRRRRTNRKVGKGQRVRKHLCKYGNANMYMQIYYANYRASVTSERKAYENYLYSLNFAVRLRLFQSKKIKKQNMYT